MSGTTKSKDKVLEGKKKIEIKSIDWRWHEPYNPFLYPVAKMSVDWDNNPLGIGVDNLQNIQIIPVSWHSYSM